MNDDKANITNTAVTGSGSGCLRVLKVAALIALLVTLFVLGWVKYNIYASKFSPVSLSANEEKILNSKLALLEGSPQKGNNVYGRKRYSPDRSLKPEQYSEAGASREISINERELNSLIANQPDIAQMVAIDLADNLVSVKLVVPVDEEVLFLGGKTLRINLGIILGYENGQPVVALKGVSLGGIPMPNAWLGYLKNENLIEEFGSEKGFWRLFAEGVDDIEVKEGHIRIRLKE